MPTALELDRKFRQCAVLAFNEFDAHNSDYIVLNSLASDHKWLMGCYRKALFGSGKEENLEKIWHNFEQCILPYLPCAEKNRMKVMLPIMFYTLIVNNEYNLKTKEKRKERDKQKSENPSKENATTIIGWKNNNPFKIIRSVAWERPESERLPSYIADLREQLKQASKNSPGGYGDLDIFYASIFSRFENGEAPNDLVYQKEMAETGMFLRDILKMSAQYQKEVTPLDTLLRMYIVNWQNGILHRTGKVPRLEQELRTIRKSNNLLVKYVDYKKPGPGLVAFGNYVEAMNQLTKEIAKHESGMTASDLDYVLKLANDCERKKEIYMQSVDYAIEVAMHETYRKDISFEEAYSELVDAYEIDNQLILELLDFYFDEEVLIESLDIVKTAKSFLINVKRKMIGIPSKKDAPLTDLMIRVGNEYIREDFIRYRGHVVYYYIAKFKNKKVTCFMPDKYRGKIYHRTIALENDYKKSVSECFPEVFRTD